MKASKLDDEKGYMNKNVEGDSNDQGQPKRNTRENRVLHISRKIQLEVPWILGNKKKLNILRKKSLNLKAYLNLRLGCWFW